mgnify:CR=1 FL=1|jgi:hypothetical protein
MPIQLLVSDKRKSTGISIKTFRLPCEAISYMNNHKVYEVTVLSGGFCFTYNPSKFKEIHK